MLESTFIYIPGIGATTETSLWGQGCRTWTDLRGNLDRYSIGTAEPGEVASYLDQSIRNLERGEHSFFRRCLGGREAWRAFPSFRNRCAYLDIETDGGHSGSSVTTIGVYDGSEFKAYVKGQNLHEFPLDIQRFGMIVTFFGTGFDLPMLEKCFPGIVFDQIHLDLCPTLRRVGHRGGLKRIEKALGISRGDQTDGLDGLDAIRLWRRYKTLRDDKALETLIAYNRDDVVNLETLACYTYDRLRRLTLGKNARAFGEARLSGLPPEMP